MNVEITKKETKVVNIVAARVAVAVRYEEEDMPNDFPHRKGELWDVTIDADTGKIRDWPEGVALDLYMKVTDCGTYELVDATGSVVFRVADDYVPGFIPGEHGDYINFKIQEDGTIANWHDKFDADNIQEAVDEKVED